MPDSSANNKQNPIELLTAKDVELSKDWLNYSIDVLQCSLNGEMSKRKEELNGIDLVAPEQLLANAISRWLLLTDIFAMQSDIMSNALEEETKIAGGLVLASSVIAKVHSSFSEQMSRLYSYTIAFKTKVKSNEETATLIKEYPGKYDNRLLKHYENQSQDSAPNSDLVLKPLKRQL